MELCLLLVTDEWDHSGEQEGTTLACFPLLLAICFYCLLFMCEAWGWGHMRACRCTRMLSCMYLEVWDWCWQSPLVIPIYQWNRVSQSNPKLSNIASRASQLNLPRESLTVPSEPGIRGGLPYPLACMLSFEDPNYSSQDCTVNALTTELFLPPNCTPYCDRMSRNSPTMLHSSVRQTSLLQTLL